MPSGARSAAYVVRIELSELWFELAECGQGFQFASGSATQDESPVVTAEFNGTGWVSLATPTVLSDVAVGGVSSAQEQAIRLAAVRGGFIERDIISSIGGYEEGQSLRGFSRPINRIAQEFRDQRIVPESAVDVLQTEYDASSGLPAGWATGFRVPDALIPLVLEWQNIRHTQALRELDSELVAAALDEFRALGHDVSEKATQDDGYGRPEWSCKSCGSSLSLAGAGEQWVSPTGRALCMRSAKPD